MIACNKTCSCGFTYLVIPPSAKYHKSGDAFEGYYFDCAACDKKTTLFVAAVKDERVAA